MALTKESFGLVITTMTQWWSPTLVRIHGDESVRGQIRKTEDGRVECDFPERLVMIANHQVGNGLSLYITTWLTINSCIRTGYTCGGLDTQTNLKCMVISSSS